jgi:hypothetical protein
VKPEEFVKPDPAEAAVAQVQRRFRRESPRTGLEPAPERERKTTWNDFLSQHREVIVAADFFTIERGSAEFRLSETLRFFAIPEEKPQTSKSAKSALPATEVNLSTSVWRGLRRWEPHCAAHPQ